MSTQAIELARNGDVVIHRKTGLSREAFEREHVRGCWPVVMTDATRDWPARTRFVPEFFKARFGEREVEVGIGDRRLKLGECIDLLLASSEVQPGPYPCHYGVVQHFPELLPEISRHVYARPDRSMSGLIPRRWLRDAIPGTEIFFGGPGGAFPFMHCDYMGLHAFINELYGRKQFTLIPPSQGACVYPDPTAPWQSLMRDHHQPDLARYPRYARATPVTITIEAGDTLFIPNGWWHTARSLEFTISVVLDRLDDSNWARFRGEVRRMLTHAHAYKPLLADAYLATLGGALNLWENLGDRQAPARWSGAGAYPPLLSASPQPAPTAPA